MNVGIYQIRNSANGKVYIGSSIDISKRYSCIIDTEKDGFNPSHITSVCKKRRKAHKGYVWRYSYE
jgi:hypothetical protein